MFDAATLREELDCMVDKDGRLKPNADMKYAIKCARFLKELERREDNGRARNGVTGY